MIGFIIGFSIAALFGVANALLLMRYAEGRSLVEIRESTIAAIGRIQNAVAYKYERAAALALEDVWRNHD